MCQDPYALTTQSLLHFIFQFSIWNRGKPGTFNEGFRFKKDRHSNTAGLWRCVKKLAKQDAELILKIPLFLEDGSKKRTELKKGWH